MQNVKWVAFVCATSYIALDTFLVIKIIVLLHNEFLCYYDCQYYIYFNIIFNKTIILFYMWWVQKFTNACNSCVDEWRLC